MMVLLLLAENTYGKVRVWLGCSRRAGPGARGRGSRGYGSRRVRRLGRPLRRRLRLPDELHTVLKLADMHLSFRRRSAPGAPTPKIDHRPLAGAGDVAFAVRDGDHNLNVFDLVGIDQRGTGHAHGMDFLLVRAFINVFITYGVPSSKAPAFLALW